jgi:hypothetical protein
MTLRTGNGARYSCDHSQTCLHERYQHQCITVHLLHFLLWETSIDDQARDSTAAGRLTKGWCCTK